MFHQVFICDASQEPECSGDTGHNNMNAVLQGIKEENITSTDPSMGSIETEDFKMALGELKMEKINIMNNEVDITMETQFKEADILPRSFINLLNSCSNIACEENKVESGEAFVLSSVPTTAPTPLQEDQIIQPLSVASIPTFTLTKPEFSTSMVDEMEENVTWTKGDIEKTIEAKKQIKVKVEAEEMEQDDVTSSPIESGTIEEPNISSSGSNESTESVKWARKEIGIENAVESNDIIEIKVNSKEQCVEEMEEDDPFLPDPTDFANIETPLSTLEQPSTKPLGPVDLERSYQICQAAIQKSRNKGLQTSRLVKPTDKDKNVDVRFQDSNGGDAKISHMIYHPISKKETSVRTRKIMTSSVSYAQYMADNSKFVDDLVYENVNSLENKLKSLYNIKECSVILNRCNNCENVTSDLSCSNLKNKTRKVLNAFGDSSCSNVKKEYLYVDDSDWEQDHLDVDDNSGSDWEQEHLNEYLKNKTKRKKLISATESIFNPLKNYMLTSRYVSVENNTLCNMNSRNINEVSNLPFKNVTYLQFKNVKNLESEKTSELQSENSSKLQSENASNIHSENVKTPESENVNKLQSQKTSKLQSKNVRAINTKIQMQHTISNITNLHLTSEINTVNIGASTSSTPYDQTGVCNSNSNLSSMDFNITKNPFEKKTNNGGTIKLNSKQFIYQLQLQANITAAKDINLQFISKKNSKNIQKLQEHSINSIQTEILTLSGISENDTKRNNNNVILNKTDLETKATLVEDNSIKTSNPAKNLKHELGNTRVRTFLPKPQVPVTIIAGSTAFVNYNKERSLDLDALFPQHVYQCSKCGKFFETSDQFIEHQQRTLCNGYRRERKYQCDICGKLFNGTEKLENHKNSHTNARPFKCSECDKFFNSKGARHVHYKSMHLNKKIRFLCCFCGYISQSITHLLAHEEAHRLPEGAEVPKPFKCTECGKGYISKYLQLNHQRRQHRLIKCKVCTDQFKNYDQLRRHMEHKHDVITRFQCEECGIQFTTKQALCNHRKCLHSAACLQYFCDICEKGFKRKGNLIQHMITHSEDRPISCPDCGDRFKRLTHLKQHTDAVHGEGRSR